MTTLPEEQRRDKQVQRSSAGVGAAIAIGEPRPSDDRGPCSCYSSRMADRAERITSFDRWVSDNNVPSTFEYAKGWWDYIELVQRFARKLDVDDVRVVGHYTVRTPPPEEMLPMPAVALARSDVTVALKFDFGAMRLWPLEWTVSVRRRSPYLGPTFGLFDPALDLRDESVGGLAPDFVFGPYRDNPAEFSCELEDEWDLATLLRMVFYEA